MACSFMINPENTGKATKLDQSLWKYLTPIILCPLMNTLSNLPAILPHAIFIEVLNTVIPSFLKLFEFSFKGPFTTP